MRRGLKKATEGGSTYRDYGPFASTASRAPRVRTNATLGP